MGGKGKKTGSIIPMPLFSITDMMSVAQGLTERALWIKG